MGGFLRQLLTAGRTSGQRCFRRGRWRPEVTPLEDRQLLAISQVVVTAVPSILSPAKGQYVPVKVSGSLAGSSLNPPKGFFYVTDQYGRIEPRGSVALRPTSGNPNLFTYSFTMNLRAKIGSQTPNGRQYDILVGATDKDNTAGKTIAVLVPKNPVLPRGTPSTHASRALVAGHSRRP